jgi:hypothetical protein
MVDMRFGDVFAGAVRIASMEGADAAIDGARVLLNGLSARVDPAVTDSCFLQIMTQAGIVLDTVRDETQREELFRLTAADDGFSSIAFFPLIEVLARFPVLAQAIFENGDISRDKLALCFLYPYQLRRPNCPPCSYGRMFLGCVLDYVWRITKGNAHALSLPITGRVIEFSDAFAQQRADLGVNDEEYQQVRLASVDLSIPLMHEICYGYATHIPSLFRDKDPNDESVVRKIQGSVVAAIRGSVEALFFAVRNGFWADKAVGLEAVVYLVRVLDVRRADIARARVATEEEVDHMLGQLRDLMCQAGAAEGDKSDEVYAFVDKLLRDEKVLLW